MSVPGLECKSFPASEETRHLHINHEPSGNPSFHPVIFSVRGKHDLVSHISSSLQNLVESFIFYCLSIKVVLLDFNFSGAIS